jgi:hypothetical protein
MSDSSLYDEVCTVCGVTDTGDGGDEPCHKLFSSADSQIKGIMKLALATAQSKGFMGEGCNFMEQCALIHTEVSEAVEAFREDQLDPQTMLRYDDTGKPIGIASEMADAFLRICNTCERFGIPLESAIYAKMKYNRKRAYRHGGKTESGQQGSDPGLYCHD